MGVKHQKGKQRKDKFYHLAKDSGYRARSAFKLIQLNRRFEFLQSARVLVDLCAAPGSWMQVARQNMPVSGVCVGVDLVPIRPLPRCISLCEDITSSTCRQQLRKQLNSRRADVVLHDGAPNVGSSWVHDAFKQAELTLAACSLAADLLRKGGWFVTKVFRSKDYHALIWVFKALFNKVHSTKPQASRNESAEIFVVCQGYKAPDKIDPKMLNPRFVFGELEGLTSAPAPLGKATKKVKAVGYSEGEASVFKIIKASDFVASSEYTTLLQNCSKIVMDTEELDKHPLTTEDIRLYCDDVKVLGKSELKNLIKWRKNVKESLQPEQHENEEQPKEEEEDALTKIDKEIAELKALSKAEAKKKRKKLMQEKRKILDKLRLSGYSSEDRIERLEPDLFSLREIACSDKLLDSNIDDIPVLDTDEPQEVSETRPMKSFDRDDNRRDALGGFDEAVEEPNDEDDMEFVDMDDEDTLAPPGLGLDDLETKATESRVQLSDVKPDLIVDESELASGVKASLNEHRINKASSWFDRDLFESIEDETEDLELMETGLDRIKIKGKQSKKDKANSLIDTENSVVTSSKTQSKQSRSTSEVDSDSDDSVDEKQTITVSSDGQSKKRIKKLSAEQFTLGSMLVHSKKARRDIIDAAYNRFMTHDENLPKWFMDDEKRHMTKPLELDRTLLAQYRERLRDVNVRPVKKVAEAKARKKRRLQKRLDKAKKKAEVVMDKDDTSTAEKARELKRIYKRARADKKVDVKYVVAKKFTTRGKRAVRPAGVKGRYKVVDPRMKKDNRSKNSGSKSNRGRKTHRTNSKKR